jgi:hypothetical protein
MAQAELTSWVSGQAASSGGVLERVPAHQAFERLGYGLFALLIFLIAFDVSEPSPYDVLALPVMLLWLALGIRMPRGALFFVALLLIYCLGIFLATVPYLDQRESVVWAITSLYLAVAAIFYLMFFSEETERRTELALKAFLACSIITAIAGIMGYFDILGTSALFTDMDRATGTFDDPNIFGSFLILSVLYVYRDLLTGEGRRPLLGFVLLPILVIGVFLSFSRATWGMTIISSATLLWMTFAASRSPLVRRRIVLLSVVAAAIGAASIVGLLSLNEVRGMVEERAHIVQPYDTGETGRFGQHLRAIPELLDRPNGFGPMRYRYMFRFNPHNTYLNSFASGGWISGLAFLGLVLATTYVGLRLSVRPSPYQRHAQIFFATHLTFVLQSFQIDVDHWRHVYLVWGAIWGLEAARVRWLMTLRTHGTDERALPQDLIGRR